MKLFVIFLVVMKLNSVFGLLDNRTSRGHHYMFRQVPYIAFVKMNGINGPGPYCTGFFIDPSWALTAAHCFYKQSQQYILNNLKIVYGTTSAYVWPYVIKPLQVIVHPRYVHMQDSYRRLTENDVALIRLSQRINTNIATYLQIENTAWSTDYYGNYIPRNCFIAGFGKNVHNDVLLHGSMFIAKRGRNACECLRANLLDSYICVRSSQDNVCMGDSGSPLVCDDVAVGVLSDIYTCDNKPLDDCEKTESIMHNLNFHVKWIRSQMYNVDPYGQTESNSPQSTNISTFYIYFCLLMIGFEICNNFVC